MRNGAGRAFPTRVVALLSPQEPSRARADLKHCFALLAGALLLLVAIVAFLVVRPGTALTASNQLAARWLLALLGVVAGVLAFVTARLFLRRSSELSTPATDARRSGRSIRRRSFVPGSAGGFG